MTEVTRRAIFFDRDGTLCREKGYINHPDRLELLPRTADALRRARSLGFATIVVTNQAGVARGYFPQHVLDETHQRLRELLAREGCAVDAIHACHHHPEVGGPGFRRICNCRKPAPGLLQRAARELDIDLAASFMVGDSFKDIGAGRAAGVRATVLLRTGYGRGELLWKEAPNAVWPDHVANDALDAVEWIAALEETTR